MRLSEVLGAVLRHARPPSPFADGSRRCAPVHKSWRRPVCQQESRGCKFPDGKALRRRVDRRRLRRSGDQAANERRFQKAPCRLRLQFDVLAPRRSITRLLRAEIPPIRIGGFARNARPASDRAPFACSVQADFARVRLRTAALFACGSYTQTSRLKIKFKKFFCAS